MNTEPRIVSVTIALPPTRNPGELPDFRALLAPNGGQAVVTAVFDDGSEEQVLRYYSDELSFTESEFVGLTRAEVRALFHRKDVAYFRS